MTKLFKKLVCFCMLFLLSAALMWFVDTALIGPQNLGNFNACIIPKLDAASSAEGPKILLVGNSNVAFGFQSQRISEAFGMPVVNLGIHGGLGNAFHENMAKLSVSPGDIVVICHNDFGDDGTIVTPSLAWLTIDSRPELLQLIPRESAMDMLKAWPGYVFDSLVKKLLGSRWNSPEENTSYAPTAFNAQGDIDFRPPERFGFWKGSVELPTISDACIDRLNELNAWILDQGAVMVVAGYPIAETQWTPSAEAYAAVEQELTARLDCPVISHYSDYRFPESAFYNTPLHLTEEGAARRTGQLILDLQNWLENKA